MRYLIVFKTKEEGLVQLKKGLMLRDILGPEWYHVLSYDVAAIAGTLRNMGVDKEELNNIINTHTNLI